VSLFSFAYLPGSCPLQRRSPPIDLPSQRERLRLLQGAYEAFTSDGYIAIGMDHFALARRQPGSGRQAKDVTAPGISRVTPPEVSLSASRFGVTCDQPVTPVVSQENADLQGGYYAALAAASCRWRGGLVVQDPEVLLAPPNHSAAMCDFRIDFDA